MGLIKRNRSRYSYNKEIVSKISKIIEMYPELRFIQILYAIGILDGADYFYEESKVTNEKIDRKLGEFEC